MSKEKKLTVKQQAFADYYVEFGNAYQAAVKAGYSECYARGNVVKWLENVSVKGYIENRMEELQYERVANKQEIMENLTSVLRGNIKDEVVMVVGDGDFGGSVEKEEKRSDTNDRTKAAELLGKRYRMWTEKHEVENITPIFVDDVPDDDD